MPYVRTGDLHIAVYDHAAMQMYVATARPDGGTGELYAYQRQFTRLDMSKLFAEAPPVIGDLQQRRRADGHGNA